MRFQKSEQQVYIGSDIEIQHKYYLYSTHKIREAAAGMLMLDAVSV